MTDRRSDAERALNEASRGGVLGYDANEAVPEALGGAKDYSGGLASQTGQSIPATSTTGEALRGSAERGKGLLEKAAGSVGDTVRDTVKDTASGVSNTLRDATSTVSDTLGYPTSARSSGGTSTTDTTENTVPRDHHGGMNPLKAFTSKGAVGSQFNPEGPLGSIPQAVGGPFDKEGIIGKQFTSEGVIGGTVDKLLGEKNRDDPLGRQK